MNINFEKAKLRRALNTHGKTYAFYRLTKNKFGEYVDDTENVVANIKALFHKANSGSYITLTTNTESRFISEKNPMLLTSYDEFNLNTIKIDDIVYINNKTYKVTGWFDVEEANYAVDISLEEVQ